MSSFFTTPKSAKRRDRSSHTKAATSTKKRNAPPPPQNTRPAKRSRSQRNESISASESESEGSFGNLDSPRAVSSDAESEAESEIRETAAEKRLRLAEQYLDNIREEVGDHGFDAKEIDRELIAQRLKEDVAESKGKAYRKVAERLDLDHVKVAKGYPKGQSGCLTGVATVGKHAYTASKGMAITKWRLPSKATAAAASSPVETNGDHLMDGHNEGTAASRTRRVNQVSFHRFDRRSAGDKDYIGHNGRVICIAASTTGKFIATGGTDRRIVVWDPTTLKPLHMFSQHRDVVHSLVFRRGTNVLFSTSADRTIKVWSLDEMAYVDTLFGHQDAVLDIDSLALERCITVGGRDRTARLWKVAEESQLIFRGGGAPKIKPSLDEQTQRVPQKGRKRPEEPQEISYHEGSTDRIVMIDEETFVTGSDNGALSLWQISKKKPLFVQPTAHGVESIASPKDLGSTDDAPLTITAEKAMEQPRYITAMAAVPFSDVFFTGSWDGAIRTWRISEDKRRIEALGALVDHSSSATGLTNGNGADVYPVTMEGVVNDLVAIDSGDRSHPMVRVIAAVGTEHRLGRWIKIKGRTCIVVLDVPLSVDKLG